MKQPVLSLALLLAVFTPLALAQEAPSVEAANFDAEAMTKRFESKLQPVLEEVLGAKFGDPVEFKITTVEGMSKILAGENRQLLAKLDGGLRGAELESQCDQIGKQMAPMVMGKIELASGSLRVVKAGFELMASIDESWKPINSQRFLDLILVHEAVHVFQHRNFDLRAFAGSPSTVGELKGRMSVIEGHAQFITRQVIEKLELQDAFDLFVAVNTEVPPSITDPIQRTQIKRDMSNLAFPYLQGEGFFKGVVGKLGYAKALERVFKSPPSTLRQVSRFEEYLNPPKDAVDLGAIGRGISELLPKNEYQSQVVPLPEASVRAALAPAGPEKVEQALAGFRGSIVVAGTSKVKAGGQTILLVMHFGSEEGAAAMLEVERIVQTKKDEQMQAEGSALTLVSADYQPTKIDGTSGFYVNKAVKVNGSPDAVVVRALVMQFGKFVMEFNYIQVPGDADTDRELARKALEVVKGGE